jgi:hypothetical protein
VAGLRQGIHRALPLEAAQRGGLLRGRPGGEPQAPEAASLHHKSIGTTNLVEPGFEEERRRSKVTPKFSTVRGHFAAGWPCSVAIPLDAGHWRIGLS